MKVEHIYRDEPGLVVRLLVFRRMCLEEVLVIRYDDGAPRSAVPQSLADFLREAGRFDSSRVVLRVEGKGVEFVPADDMAAILETKFIHAAVSETRQRRLESVELPPGKPRDGKGYEMGLSGVGGAGSSDGEGSSLAVVGGCV